MNINFGHAPVDKRFYLPANRLSNFGQKNDRLCSLLKAHLKIPDSLDIVLCSSGHTALMAAYAVSGAKSFLMPAYTFESTRCAATLMGKEVKIVDVDPVSGCLEAAQVVDGTDAVVSVAALSVVPNMSSLREATKDKVLIIDGAASFGSPIDYTLCDYFCLSFHGTKTLPIGEGGAVICSVENAKKIKQFINFGFDEDRVPQMIGMNAKLSEYACDIGIDLLGFYVEGEGFEPVDIYHRKTIVKLYASACRGYAQPSHFVYQGYPVSCRTPEDSIQLTDKLTKAGIETKRYYRPLESGFPITERFYSTNVTIPCHSRVNLEAASLICELIHEHT